MTMKITQNHHASGSIIELEGDLTIYTVSAAKTALFADYENYVDPIALDASKITEIDTAGVQLLVFVKKILTDENKRVHIKSSNDTVSDILSNFAISSQFTLTP